MNLPFPNVREAVGQLRKNHFQDYYVLPFNRFNIDHSAHWWLAPTGDRATFRYPKVVLSTDEEWVKPDHVFCGFTVEKGLLTKFGSQNSNHVMDKNWFWHEFLKISVEDLQSAVNEASGAIGEPLEIYVACGILTEGAAWDLLLMHADSNGLEQRSLKVGDGLLAEVAKCVDVASFQTAMRELDGSATKWQWMEVSFGRQFTLDPSGANDLASCGRMLRPFRGLMDEYV